MPCNHGHFHLLHFKIIMAPIDVYFFLLCSCLLARFSEVKMEEGCNKGRGKRERSGGSDVFLMKTNHTTGITHRVQNTHGGVPTCSLTEARMEEVVSVSVLSPLEAGITGATMAPFSCSAGCSGTGIAIMNRNMHEENTPLALSVNLKGAKQQAITITSSWVSEAHLYRFHSSQSLAQQFMHRVALHSEVH